MMHAHIRGSNRAKFDDDDDFNSFRGIACEGHTHRQTYSHRVGVKQQLSIYLSHTERLGVVYVKVCLANKKGGMSMFVKVRSKYGAV